MIAPTPFVPFLRFERHALSCAPCAPVYEAQLVWDGRGRKPGPLCGEGERLWSAYVSPAAPAPEAGHAVIAAEPCGWCRREAPLPGMRLCAACREANAARLRERYEARRASGTCVDCALAPPSPPHASCEGCLKDRNEGHRAAHLSARARRRAEGLCHKCGKVRPESGRAKCVGCRAVVMDRYRRRAAEGTCCSCRKTPADEGMRTCGPCRSMEAARKKAAYVPRRPASPAASDAMLTA